MSKSVALEPDRLLLTTASVIAESVQSMQQAVNRIADLTMSRDQPMPEMVVALQAFDRLTQEFDALSAMLESYAHNPASDRGSVEQLIQAIPLSELKHKVLAATFGNAEVEDLLEIGATVLESDRVF